MRLARLPDKRRFPRWDAGRATFDVRCGVTESALRLVDFSAAGMSVVFERPRDADPHSPVPLVLSRGEASFARIVLGVASGTRSGGAERIGGPILSRAFLPFGAPSPGGIGDASELRDAVLEGDLLERLRRQDPPLRVAVEGGGAYPARIQGAFAIGAPIPLLIEGPPFPLLPLSDVSISFGLDGGGFALRGSLARGGDGYVVLPPFALVSRSRRHADRVRVPSQRAVLSWSNVLVPGERIFANVEDLSALGARVRPHHPVSSYPPPGEPVLLHVDGLALSLHAEVRHVDDSVPTETTFGVRFVLRSLDDVVRLAKAVERVSFPDLHPRASVPRGEVVDLLRVSGYLDLREPGQEPRPWHDAADAQLSIDSVHRRADGVLDGHVSCTRAYRRTWLFQQLATLGQGRIAMKTRRAIYLSATGWVSLLSQGDGYAMAYFDRRKRWHSTFFESFIRWSGDETIATIAALDRFELSSEPRASLPDEAAPWDVGEARPDEVASAASALRAAMPPLLARAMDVEAGLLSTPELSPPHAAAGLERARTLLVVRDGGEACAFALCETGSSRLSLFNLLNIAHVVVTSAAPAAAQRALLGAVVAFYATRGTAAPLVVAEPSTVTEAEASGFALVETMGCLLLSSEGLKQYRNFLAYHFGRFERPNRAG